MINRELLCINHLLIVTFHLCASKFDQSRAENLLLHCRRCVRTDDVRVEAGVSAQLSSAAAAQLVMNNRGTIWLCLDRGFAEFGRQPIWCSQGSGKFVPVNCNYSTDAIGYSSFSAAASTSPFISRSHSSFPLFTLASTDGLMHHRSCWIHIPLPNYWHTHTKNVKRKMGTERDAKNRGRQREGGERRDGIRVDFALLRFILCLLRISSYLTCALLDSPLHQVQPVFASDS